VVGTARNVPKTVENIRRTRMIADRLKIRASVRQSTDSLKFRASVSTDPLKNLPPDFQGVL
jgi:hypothetical protein